jgi:thiaminase
MREKRAGQLYEEFCDHWSQNNNPEKMEVLTKTLEHIGEVSRKTRNNT